MGALLPLVATFILLSLASLALARVGRRRRRTRRALPPDSRLALERSVGERLAALAAAAVALRAQLEDTLAGNRDMLLVEVQLGGGVRRPMWRHIEDANFGDDLARARVALRRWLAELDGLGGAEQDLLATLDLSEALEALRGFDRSDPQRERPADRAVELSAVQRDLEAAIAGLRRFEQVLVDYRPSAYR